MTDDRYPDQDDDELVVEEIVIEDIDVQPEPPAGEPLLQTEGQELLVEEEGSPTTPVGRNCSPRGRRFVPTSPVARRKKPRGPTRPTTPAASGRMSGTPTHPISPAASERANCSTPNCSKRTSPQRRPETRRSTSALLLEFVEGPGPIVFEQTGQRTVGQQPAVRLAGGAVVGLVVGVGDPLHRRAASRARFVELAVDRHLLSEGGDPLGPPLPHLQAKSTRSTCSTARGQPNGAAPPPRRSVDRCGWPARDAPPRGSRRSMNSRSRKICGGR